MALTNLLARMGEIHNVEMANAVLGWDQLTYMPAKGGEARARQLATLAKIAHEMLVARETQDLLAAAEGEAGQWGAESKERAMLRVARRTMDKQTKVPTELVVAMAEAASRGQDVWQQARAEDKYELFAPWLEKLLGLKREYARCVMPGVPVFDALLDEYEEGMTSVDVGRLFEAIKGPAVGLVAAIREKGRANSDEILKQHYDPEAQKVFCTHILKECGFPFERARLDTSVHPFCSTFSRDDVRITTRWEPEWLPGALFGCMHEMGHAFYELAIAAEYEATPLAGGVSLGVHESQSRLWENMVGRSREFWERYYPELQKAFPGQLKGRKFEEFHRAINRVAPSLIRVEADEVTYNLHILLRYEMEQALLKGELSVAEAPGAWNEKMKRYLGVVPATDREGILQDVHWAFGGFGYFPTYSMGNVLAAQFFAAAERALPGLRGDIAAGRFEGLRGWLGEQVHQHGKRYVPAELVRRATGTGLSTEAYLKYLTEKFGGIYGL